MGYKQALEAAGANVLEYNEFGSYQGDWAALCELNSERVIITGSYGSCSGCDSFEAEFSYNDKPEEVNGKFYFNYEEVGKSEFDKKNKEYQKHLAEFGQGYLENPSTKDIIQTRLDNLQKDDWFSDEEKEMLEWCIEQFNKTAIA